MQRRIPASSSGVSFRTRAPPPRRASSPSTRRPRTPCGSGHARPAPPPSAPRRRTGRPPWPIDDPLKRPRPRREQRPDLAQIVIDDRLARLAAQRPQQLPDSHSRQPRIVLSSRWISSLNGSSLDPRRPLIARRNLTLDRPPDRVAMQPRPAMDLPNREPTHEVQPPNLSPFLHTDHLSSRARSPRTSPGSQTPGRLLPTPQGVHFQPAEGGESSTGADKLRPPG